jgi:protein-tyrosine phosphatase
LSTNGKIRVLMVCMGNICRSPTAEAVLRKLLADAGLDAEVDSAGTHGYHVGEPPDARAVKHGKARGYDLSKLRARRVSRDDFDRFDWILAMDADNLERLRDMAPPGSRARLGLLLEHSARYAEIREVPDPYYGAPAGFDRVLDLVEDGCAGLIARLRADQGTS